MGVILGFYRDNGKENGNYYIMGAQASELLPQGVHDASVGTHVATAERCHTTQTLG